MNCKKYAEMIYLESLDLKNQIDNCEDQYEASLLRKHCLKIRHDLKELHDRLGRFENED